MKQAFAVSQATTEQLNIPQPNPVMNLLPLVVIIGIVWFISKANRNKSNTLGGQTMGKRIQETKCTCQACGNIWYYGKKELWDNRADRMINFGKEGSNLGSDMMCCGGCLPALFIPKEQVKQVKDLNKCPKCNSSAVRKEEVVHEV